MATPPTFSKPMKAKTSPSISPIATPSGSGPAAGLSSSMPMASSACGVAVPFVPVTVGGGGERAVVGFRRIRWIGC